jgi:hypothetical protein
MQPPYGARFVPPTRRGPLPIEDLMNMTLIKLVACIAWAAAAISGATPAEAIAVTVVSGNYATCSASYTTGGQTQCGYSTSYRQNIKFVSIGCSLGGCNEDSGGVYTDFVYPTGRKSASLVVACNGLITYNVYNLGSCAC